MDAKTAAKILALILSLILATGIACQVDDDDDKQTADDDDDIIINDDDDDNVNPIISGCVVEKSIQVNPEEGGELNLADGARLIINAGSLETVTTIGFGVTAVVGLPDGASPNGKIYCAEPAGVGVVFPVTLLLPLETTADHLAMPWPHVYYSNSLNEQSSDYDQLWKGLAIAAWPAENTSVVVHSDKLGWFMIAEPIAEITETMAGPWGGYVPGAVSNSGVFIQATSADQINTTAPFYPVSLAPVPIEEVGTPPDNLSGDVYRLDLDNTFVTIDVRIYIPYSPNPSFSDRIVYNSNNAWGPPPGDEPTPFRNTLSVKVQSAGLYAVVKVP